MSKELHHEDIIGKHSHLFARSENFTPPTSNPQDCICGAKGDPEAGRLLIPNCPCCDGVQVLTQELCDCPDDSFVKVKAVICSPNWIRRIENVEPI